MEKLFKILIVLFVSIVGISLILQLTIGKKENFGGGGHGGGGRVGAGSASYQNSYSGVNADDYSEGYRKMKMNRQMMGNDCYKGPKRTYGNSWMEYQIDGYWDYQPKEDRFRGCLNLFMLNCGTDKKCYDEGVKVCENA